MKLGQLAADNYWSFNQYSQDSSSVFATLCGCFEEDDQPVFGGLR